MELHFEVKKLAEIAKKYHLRFVILHGSYVTGKQREDSDIDIAVLGDKNYNSKLFFDLHSELSHVFGNSPHHELDLKTLHRVDPFFRHEVVRFGKLLYGDSTEYEEFKAFTNRAFEDAKPLLDLERKLSDRYQKHLNKLVHAQP